MSGLLAGRSVLVTGGAQAGGIGAAISRACAEHGARVHIASRSADAARRAADGLKGAGFDARGHGCDITDDASVARLVRDVGDLQGIVHNAGVAVGEWDRPFADVPMEDFRRVFEVDVLAAARVTRAFLPALKARGGSLVFTSSTPAIAGYEHLHEFTPAKAAVLGLMRGLAAELGRDNVRANAVAYGNIASSATWDALDDAQRAALAAESPMRRWGTTADAAGVSVFLLSGLSAFVNGQTIVVDGGTVMR